MTFSFGQFLFLIVTYLIAAIPFGLLVSEIFAGKDIREFGSKNIGATNVARVLGKKLGFITLILDGLKGAVMVVIARFIFSYADGLNIFLSLTAAVAVIGHIYPVYLKFKGGKGVATTLAVLFAVNPIIGLVNLISWIAIFLITRTSAISALGAIVITTIFALYSKALTEEILLCIFLMVIIFIRHKENIARIKAGKENKF